MKIQTSTPEIQVHSVEYKEGSTFSGYHFIGCDVILTLTFDENEHHVTLQTGHNYDGGDYNRPSNSLRVYDDGSSDLLWKLDQLTESELNDNETIAEINEYCETSYTKNELQDIYFELNEAIADAQSLVDEAEQEADDEKENDKTIYVIQEYVEEIEIEDGVFVKEQCGFPTVEIFTDKDDADEYIENNLNSYIDFEKGRALNKEFENYNRNYS